MILTGLELHASGYEQQMYELVAISDIDNQLLFQLESKIGELIEVYREKSLAIKAKFNDLMRSFYMIEQVENFYETDNYQNLSKQEGNIEKEFLVKIKEVYSEFEIGSNHISNYGIYEFLLSPSCNEYQFYYKPVKYIK